MVGYLQSQLPQQLRPPRIKTVAAAYRFLKKRFVPTFAVRAAEPGSAFVPYQGRALADGAHNCDSAACGYRTRQQLAQLALSALAP